MAREVAGYDVSRYDQVMLWPLRELFLAYVEKLKDHAEKTYRAEMQEWALTAPHSKKRIKPPELPRILRPICLTRPK